MTCRRVVSTTVPPRWGSSPSTRVGGTTLIEGFHSGLTFLLLVLVLSRNGQSLSTERSKHVLTRTNGSPTHGRMHSVSNPDSVTVWSHPSLVCVLSILGFRLPLLF